MDQWVVVGVGPVGGQIALSTSLGITFSLVMFYVLHMFMTCDCGVDSSVMRSLQVYCLSCNSHQAFCLVLCHATKRQSTEEQMQERSTAMGCHFNLMFSVSFVASRLAWCLVP